MGQFINSINEVRKSYSPYDNWEQQQADERAKKEYLTKTLDIPEDKVELTRQRAETVIRATEIMDTRSEDNCQNMEQMTGIVSMIPVLGIQFGQIPLTDRIEKLATKSLQAKIDSVQAQIKKTDIHDDIFDELIKKRDSLTHKKWKIADKIRNVSPFVALGLMLATSIGMIVWSNSKQKDASRLGRFQAKNDELKGIENFITYTPEQLEKAQKIAETIPEQKERNSFKKLVKELTQMSKDQKAYQEWLANKNPDEIKNLKAANLLPEQIEKGKENQELIVDVVKDINIKSEEYSENVENTFDTLGTLSWLAAIPLGLGINKIMKLFKASPKIKNIVSTTIPIVTPVIISLMGTLEEKNASRIGRYKARQDLLKNPASLMAFSDEEMAKAKDIKADKQKQGFFQKIGQSFNFLTTYIKDKKEYNNYKKTTQKQNEKIYKALKQIETTDTQKQEAKEMQKHIFRAFDEVDEMSQRYSEDVEAGTEIAKTLGTSAWSIGSILGIAYLTSSIQKGKFPLAKVVNWLTNIAFDTKSPIKQGVNNLYSVLKTHDKTTVQKFQKAIVGGKYYINSFFRDKNNADIKEAFMPLMEEFSKIGQSGIMNAVASGGNKKMSEIFNELFSEHLKQTPIAKWTRNMLTQCTKLWAKSKMSKMDIELPKDAAEKFGLNFNYKNYGTLINTGAVAGVPALGVIFGVPYAFNSWLTSIQKKAGKIGIMKAMERIDDPKVFAPEKTTTAQTPEQEKPSQPKASNLLAQYQK